MSSRFIYADDCGMLAQIRRNNQWIVCSAGSYQAKRPLKGFTKTNTCWQSWTLGTSIPAIRCSCLRPVSSDKVAHCCLPQNGNSDPKVSDRCYAAKHIPKSHQFFAAFRSAKPTLKSTQLSETFADMFPKLPSKLVSQNTQQILVISVEVSNTLCKFFRRHRILVHAPTKSFFWNCC